MKNTLQKSAISLAIIASLGLSGCLDKQADAPLETTSINTTTTGVITGFGSVFINGVEYETDTSSVMLDGTANAAGHDAGLKLGMVVTVSGDSNGVTGNAASISFNDEVEGAVTVAPAASATGGFTVEVMGITVNTDDDTVFDSNVSTIPLVSDLVLGNIVEVSGYSAGDGTVWATRIELRKEVRDANDVSEITGMISNLDPNTNTFNIGNMQITVPDAVLTEEGITTALADGMLVEVKSDTAADETTGILTASKMSIESESGKKEFDFDMNDDEVEVEGVITAAAATGATEFDVNGTTVTFDTNTVFVNGTEATLATAGLKVKLKGGIDANGVFLAEKVMFKPTGDISMSGALSSADIANNTITMLGLTIALDNSTFVEDDRDLPDGEENVKYKFGADDLAKDDWLEVKAYKDSAGNLVASKMIRKTKETGDVSELKGKIDATDSNNVAGMTVDWTNSAFPGGNNGDRVEISGTYDEATGKFMVADGEVDGSDRMYVGGDDAENKEMEEPSSDDMEMSTSDSDMSNM